MRERIVDSALALMQGVQEQVWSIDELGRRVGLSRSALDERCIELIGVPPMQYLVQWRMLAALRQSRGAGTTAPA